MISRIFIVMLAIVLFESRAIAAERTNSPVEIPVGPFDLRPLLEVSESYNDNIWSNNLLQKASMVTQIRSGFQLALERGLNRYALNYSFLSSQYHDSPHDNYVDQYVNGQAHVELTSRNRLDFNAGWTGNHYMRGTGFSQANFSSNSTTHINANEAESTQLLPLRPVAFQDVFAETVYRYGSKTSRANIELLARVDNISFNSTDIRYTQWDSTQVIVTPGFYYRVFPKTYATLQVENNLVAYSNHKINDYTKQRYLIGVKWEQSVKTQGSLRLGYLQQRFDYDYAPSPGFDDFTWDINVRWLPQTYSELNLNLNRDVYPTFGFGTSRLIETYGVNWQHHWTSRLSTTLSGTYYSVDNRGASRQDDIVSIGFDANYYLTRWLGVGINYAYRDQQSTGHSDPPNSINYNLYNYQQNVIMFYITGNPEIRKYIQQTPWQTWYN